MSQMIPPFILAMYIFNQPESPRWLLAKAQKTGNKKRKSKYYKTVFQDLTKLRNSELLAARDMILMNYRLKKEEELRKLANTIWYRRGIYELFSKRRNRRAVTASLIVMFFQQFCGMSIFWVPSHVSAMSRGKLSSNPHKTTIDISYISTGINVLIYFSSFVL